MATQIILWIRDPTLVIVIDMEYFESAERIVHGNTGYERATIRQC